MTENEHIEKINNMSHEDMARLWRFAPSGHLYFDETLPYVKHFMKRYNKFGGMSSSISKRIGW